MAAIAASMAQVTAPSMIKLESARPTGKVLDNIGDKPIKQYYTTFPNKNLAK